MEADAKSVQFSNTIGCRRLFAALFLTPLVMAIWLGESFDATVAHYGGNPDGPARVMLGAFLIMIGFGVPFLCLLFLGLPYTLIMAKAGRLNFLAILLPTLPIAVLYSLLVYSSLNPDRFAAPARMMGLAAVPGVLVASLCFYLVGVWRNTARRSCAT